MIWFLIAFVILYIPIGMASAAIQFRRGKLELWQISAVIVAWPLYWIYKLLCVAFPFIEKVTDDLVRIVVRLAGKPKQPDAPAFTDILGDHK